ncbi:hypothetical protein LO772_25620 [Yinghuangia sp. ASG 101]|uniref:peptidase MA family metallohydrolase n=1 Tax=Yinghuangia sp. ASG 101 TaxID=2896848 RepID=UPI001E320F58|nr:hypothetical protein [Yinghuangia sp. ASG 101]UGQ10232.1 hypothetical protein LO772_25620 [Yinghuangia sp. ASG 101]
MADQRPDGASAPDNSRAHDAPRDSVPGRPDDAGHAPERAPGRASGHTPALPSDSGQDTPADRADDHRHTPEQTAARPGRDTPAAEGAHDSGRDVGRTPGQFAARTPGHARHTPATEGAHDPGRDLGNTSERPATPAARPPGHAPDTTPPGTDPEPPADPEAAPSRSRGGPHPALVPVMVIGTVLALLLGAAGLFGGSDAHDVAEATRGGTSAAAHGAPPARPTGPPASAPATRNEITADQLKALADAQTQALRTGDVDAFLAPYDQGDAGLLAERRRTFANLRLLPFQFAEFRWENVYGGNLKAVGTEPVNARLTFAFVHQIPGVDAVPARQAYRWTVTRDAIGAPLRVTAVEFKDPQPWDLAELIKVERPHVILLAATADRFRAGTWADRAETSAKRDFELWKGPAGIPSRFLVFASPDTDTFGRAYGGTAPAGTVAFCAPLYPDEDTSAAAGTVAPPPTGGAPARQIAGSRITWNTDAEGLGAADAQTAVMRHEMGHALIAGFSGSRNARIPLWVVEGFAEYLEWADLLGDFYAPAAREFVRGTSFPGKLPADDDIYGDGSETNGINYHLSMTVFHYMVEKYGAAKTFAFVVAVYRAPGELDAALKTATGLDLATFEAKWAQWVKSTI